MSLDVYLRGGPPPVRDGSGIFVRRDGCRVEITRAEWDEKFPGAEPVVFADVSDDLFHANITHNLGPMAEAAGIYKHLWRPDEIGITRAEQLIDPLRAGLKLLREDRPQFEALNPSNGWGTYHGMVGFVEEYLAACEEHPEAEVSVSR